jgi:phosphatidylglycerol:prolipoprotein diacylglycerol transferase
MLTYPNINPVAFYLGALPVHWYGLMYLFGFASTWILATYRARYSKGLWTEEHVSDLIFYGALGVILGGRIGYMIFYNWPVLLHDPFSLLKIWQGGMAFHGGLLGVLIALWLFSRKYHKTFFEVTDFLAPFVPIGLGAGRIGNFINGELWGKVTQQPWGMVFPTGGPLPRHPSQLYEALLEGLLLFIILILFSAKPRPKMAVSGLFLLCYGCFRIFCEFFRVPDVQLGYLFLGWLTMGQILSIPMILAGLTLLFIAYTHSNSIFGAAQAKSSNGVYK